jgi:hypothetical protein
MSLLEHFPHTLTFSHRTHTRGTIGGQMTTLTSFATAKEGWVQSASHREVTEFQKRDQKITHKVLLAPADADLLTVDDVLTVTAGDTFVGKKYQVRSVGEASAGLGWVSTAYLTEE